MMGAYGMNNDAGIFRASKFGKAIEFSSRQFFGKGRTLWTTAHLFVGDEAFPLSSRMLHPYGGKGHNEKERIFNYKLVVLLRMPLVF